ncbi:MAG: TldD/PmbA family protein [Candidatus Eisenbacteria sp.]|nr:TldD/PmbA family protein [Candidatus Eisenbacteria bacterium]
MDRISRRTFIKDMGKGLGVGAAALSAPAWFEHAVAQAQLDIPSHSEMYNILTRALSRGGHYSDLFLEVRQTAHIVIASSEIKAMEYGILKGGGVRTVFGEKVGYAYAETFDPETLADVADTAARIAAGGGGIQPIRARRMNFPQIISARKPIGDAEVVEKVRILERVDHAARAVGPHVKQVRIDYRDAAQVFTVVSSDGRLVTDELPVIYLRVTVSAARGEAVAEGMCRVSGRRGMELLDGSSPEDAGRAAAQQALRMLDARPAPTGEMPVVIAKGGGVMFHEAVGHGLEADAVLKNSTVFAGRVGEKVATELVTLHDDSTIPGMRGSFNVDDEGTPGKKAILIEKGVLKGYMQDLRTAYNMGEETTANGRRQSFRHPAIVRMTNTNLLPGVDNPDEIVKETKRGVFAANFGGGEVDVTSGQFTFGLREAYLIEDGRITAPIKGANLVGSGPEVLTKIDRMGSDFDSWAGTCGKSDQWVPVTSGCPTLRVTGITVGGTA